MEKLRVLRNSVYGHAGDAKLSEKDFDSYWKTTEGEILTLSRCCGDTIFDQSVRQSMSKVRLFFYTLIPQVRFYGVPCFIA